MLGPKTMVAGCIDEALSIAEDEQPDAILIDANLNGADGIAALPALRSLAPNTALIVFTGAMSGSARSRSLQLGADAYISKLHVGRIRELVREIVLEARVRRRDAG